VSSNGVSNGHDSLSSPESASQGGVIGGAVGGGTAGVLCLMLIYFKLRKRRQPPQQPHWSTTHTSHTQGSTDEKNASEAPASAPRPALVEMVEILRNELGVRGNHVEVIHNSARQLGLATANVPLTVIAKQCIQALGIALSPQPLPAPRASPRTQGQMERDGFALRLLLEGNAYDSKVLGSLQQLLQPAEPAYLGKDKALQQIHGPYDRLKLACAWRIDHPTRRDMYDAGEKKVQKELNLLRSKGKDVGRLPGLPARTSSSANDLFGLNAKSNETLLLHGTGPDRLLSLIAQGLNERFAGGNAGTLFGDGIYLAEDIGKADQYVEADTCYGKNVSARERDLHERLYCAMHHPGHVFYVLVCRTALGYPVRTKQWKNQEPVSIDNGEQVFPAGYRELSPVPGVSPPIFHHSLIVERGPGHTRYREFLTFHSEYVYPEFLVAYHRYNGDQVVLTHSTRT